MRITETHTAEVQETSHDCWASEWGVTFPENGTPSNEHTFADKARGECSASPWESARPPAACLLWRPGRGMTSFPGREEEWPRCSHALALLTPRQGTVCMYWINISLAPCARHYSKSLTTMNSLSHDNSSIIPTRKWGPKFAHLPQITWVVSSPNSPVPCPATSLLTLFFPHKQNSHPCYMRFSSRFDIPDGAHKVSVL